MSNKTAAVIFLMFAFLGWYTTSLAESNQRLQDDLQTTKAHLWYYKHHYGKIESALGQIKMQEYNIDTYNCTHFTADAISQLQFAGIYAKHHDLWTTDNGTGKPGYHRIVMIGFEPQTGMPADTTHYFDKIKNRN